MSMEAIKQATPLVVDFSGSITAAAVDRVLMYEYINQPPFEDAEEVHLDFSQTVFSELAALQSIVAFARTILAQHKRLLFRLPASRKERDFWRAWHFPQALELATGRTFRELCSPSDFGYFGETQIFFLPPEANLEGDVGELEESADQRMFLNHFPIYGTQIDRRQKPADIAYQFKNTWNGKHVQRILRKKIGKNYGYLASRVVFEAILNAIRHPGATLIETGAIDHAASKKSKATSYLNVHFWDNGASIADTLYKAIQRGVPVREMPENDEERTNLARNYLLRYEPDLNGPSQDQIVSFESDLSREDATAYCSSGNTFSARHL